MRSQWLRKTKYGVPPVILNKGASGASVEENPTSRRVWRHMIGGSIVYPGMLQHSLLRGRSELLLIRYAVIVRRTLEGQQ